MRPEPTQDQLLALLEANPHMTQNEAIRRLWGSRMSDTEHQRVSGMVRKWVFRARQRGVNLRNQPEHGPQPQPPPVTRPRDPAEDHVQDEQDARLLTLFCDEVHRVSDYQLMRVLGILSREADRRGLLPELED